MQALNTSHRRAPGIRFEVPQGVSAPTIPRMDIAAFVGFAAAGPVGIPVAVEDVAQFRAVFGDDARLAWDSAAGDWSRAHLGPAVQDFFRTGGKRCWVLRVANTGAVSNSFPLSGVRLIAPDGKLHDAAALARSEGSWSDTLRVTVELLLRPIVSLSTALPGDLVRLTHRDGSGEHFGFVSQDPARFEASYFVASGAQAAAPSALPPLDSTVSAAVVTFSLLVKDGDQASFRMDDLGFGPAHPNYWGNLLTDAARFQDLTTPAPRDPIFPLAGGTGLYSIPSSAGEPSGPLSTGKDPLERDGLVPLSAALFLDPKLAATGSADLLREADFLRFGSPAPRRLKGIHALLGIDEIAIVAAPDAVQAGWIPRAIPPIPPPVPSAPRPQPGPSDFSRCALRQMPAPNLKVAQDPAHPENLTLTWTASSSAARFSVQESRLPDFENAQEIFNGASTELDLYGRSQGIFYYRVSATDGLNTSDWSNGVAVAIGAPAGYETAPSRDASMLPAVAEGLLRLCAAKGDWFAVLSLPPGARWDDAAAYTRQLQATGDGLSHGALFHPWLIIRDETRLAGFRTTPPCGAMAGVLARRAATRGPWIAPANEPLSGVVSTDVLTRREDRDDWFDIPVNWIFREPRGFLTLSADTLSLDDDLVPISVRRLLGLLRRMALDRGQPLVFEPNGDALRRLVQSEFAEMLGDLFRRGAFAGRTPDQSFQVVVNQQAEATLIVELRVAPSVPLKFLTVRLVQTDDRRLQLESV